MSFELTLEEGKFLVRFARQAIEHYLRAGEKIELPEVGEMLETRCGLFVTLRTHPDRELRGCIGYTDPIYPLIEAVRNSAISSATEDPRFLPLSLEELKRVTIEISVLTPPSPIEVENRLDLPKAIEIGRDGLVVERGWSKGVLLPQVPIEWKWSAEEFLIQCCLKAGLPPDAWLLPETRVCKFQAIIFEEEEPSGEVRRVVLKPE